MFYRFLKAMFLLSVGFLAVAILFSCTVTPVPPVVVPPPPQIEVETLQPVGWVEVDGWPGTDLLASFEAFVASCRVLKHKEDWSDACAAAVGLEARSGTTLLQYYEQWFVPHKVHNDDGSDTGTITGYYVPDLDGSRVKTERFSYPLYAIPEDLVIIDLREVYPELGSYRLRGRLEGRRVVPYYSRAELNQGVEALAGKEIFWVDDPVELFFLHIQGSGRIRLENGEKVMVNYADQNGHPYRSIGRLLIDRGAMTRDQMSMQNIRKWARNNPEQVWPLLAENPSYIFFRELEPEFQSPPGSLGIPLTPEISLAVDPRTIPLGAPVFLSTTWPYNPRPLNKLMVAQDTGGAIKGQVRGDFFWGMGDEAGALAGRMKQDGRFWVLLPRSGETIDAGTTVDVARDDGGAIDGG
jgi:membrane-bound lytic murein transglycosylase A